MGFNNLIHAVKHKFEKRCTFELGTVHKFQPNSTVTCMLQAKNEGLFSPCNQRITLQILKFHQHQLSLLFIYLLTLKERYTMRYKCT